MPTGEEARTCRAHSPWATAYKVDNDDLSEVRLRILLDSPENKKTKLPERSQATLSRICRRLSMWSWASLASIVAKYVISDIPRWVVTLVLDRYRHELNNRDCFPDEKYLSTTVRFL